VTGARKQREELMKTTDMLTEALDKACDLDKLVRRIIRDVDDYDLLRLLKKIDAEFKDIQHNLSIAMKLAQSLDQKPKRKRSSK
jgi:hypothetical protein